MLGDDVEAMRIALGAKNQIDKISERNFPLIFKVSSALDSILSSKTAGRRRKGKKKK
jgi:hypothetical protein